MPADLSADDVIALLGLAPHPEGGHFRETFRDTAAAGQRAASTAIYFLLKQGEQSHWHAVDAAEGWHFYAGDALLLEISPPGGPVSSIRLGPHVADGERPQAIVPKGHWQRARSPRRLDARRLHGCARFYLRGLHARSRRVLAARSAWAGWRGVTATAQRQFFAVPTPSPDTYLSRA